MKNFELFTTKPSTRYIKGVTLLEILIIIIIFTVLIGLAFVAIQTSQRASRDNERRTYLNAINLEISDYYGAKRAYPPLANMVLDRTSNTIVVGAGGQIVQLKNSAIPLPTTATTSTSAGSVYCYSKVGNSYTIGVNLEAGTWFNVGTATPCSAANL